jgi:hypothetical protein
VSDLHVVRRYKFDFRKTIYANSGDKVTNHEKKSVHGRKPLNIKTHETASKGRR